MIGLQSKNEIAETVISILKSIEKKKDVRDFPNYDKLSEDKKRLVKEMLSMVYLGNDDVWYFVAKISQYNRNIRIPAIAFRSPSKNLKKIAKLYPWVYESHKVKGYRMWETPIPIPLIIVKPDYIYFIGDGNSVYVPDVDGEFAVIESEMQDIEKAFEKTNKNYEIHETTQKTYKYKIGVMKYLLPLDVFA